MLSRVCAIRSLNALKQTPLKTSPVVVQRAWASGDVSKSDGSSQRVLKAWEEHPDVTEYELSDGRKNLMIGHQFIAHHDFIQGSAPAFKRWVMFFVASSALWLTVYTIARTKFEVRPYPWFPLGIAWLSKFEPRHWTKYNLDPSHYYQDFDEVLDDPNAEEEEDEDEDED